MPCIETYENSTPGPMANVHDPNVFRGCRPGQGRQAELAINGVFCIRTGGLYFACAILAEGIGHSVPSWGTYRFPQPFPHFEWLFEPVVLGILFVWLCILSVELH